nr:immunoglobulin heavy chain junction region [Mus musculus]
CARHGLLRDWYFDVW